MDLKELLENTGGAGLPALSLPVPASADVIASMQVIGHSEEQVVAFGRLIEAAVGG